MYVYMYMSHELLLVDMSCFCRLC